MLKLKVVSYMIAWYNLLLAWVYVPAFLLHQIIGLLLSYGFRTLHNHINVVHAVVFKTSIRSVKYYIAII